MKKILCFIFALTVISFIFSCSYRDGAAIDGSWEQINGKETIIFGNGTAKCLWDGRQTWTGNYKKSGDSAYDITTGVIGIYTKPMRASISTDGILTLEGDGSILAKYRKKQ